MSFQLWDLLQDTPLCEGAGLGRDCERDALFNLHPHIQELFALLGTDISHEAEIPQNCSQGSGLLDPERLPVVLESCPLFSTVHTQHFPDTPSRNNMSSLPTCLVKSTSQVPPQGHISDMSGTPRVYLRRVHLDAHRSSVTPPTSRQQLDLKLLLSLAPLTPFLFYVLGTALNRCLEPAADASRLVKVSSRAKGK